MTTIGRLRSIPAMTWAIMLAGLAAAGIVVVLASVADPSTTLTASFHVVSPVSGGYHGRYTIHNSASRPVSGWTVAFDLPTGTTVRSVSAARLTRHANHYQFTATNREALVAAHGDRTFDFDTKGSGTPSNCSVNRMSCAGAAMSKLSRDASPSPTRSPNRPSGPRSGQPPSRTPSRGASPSTGPTGRAVPVATADQLSAALADARSGDTITLAAGRYEGAFATVHSGTDGAPITLTGPRTAVLSNPSGYGLHLDGASFWRLVGFTVADSAQGVVLDASSHDVLDGVEVTGTGAEGVLLRAASSDNLVTRSWIHHAGAGLTVSDGSDRDQVADNRFGPDIAAGYLAVNAGTTGGVVSGNTFDGAAVDAWVAVQGSRYTFTANTASGMALVAYRVSGCGNVWRDNRSDLGGAGEYAVQVGDRPECAADPDVVYASNTVVGATKGLTDLPVTVN